MEQAVPVTIATTNMTISKTPHDVVALLLLVVPPLVLVLVLFLLLLAEAVVLAPCLSLPAPSMVVKATASR